jgi:Protein phosphatase 2C
LRLAGAVTQGSGTINEDGFGYLGSTDDVTAVWVFDGVTGINGQNYLPDGTDAAWLVNKAHKHLLKLADLDLKLSEILSQLIQNLIADWNEVAGKLNLPENYDPPAACLILAKSYDKVWKAVRLGDSCLLARTSDGGLRVVAASPNNTLDHWLASEANKRRDAGLLDMSALLAEFRPQLTAGRKLRNTPEGYSILEVSPTSTKFAEYIDLGSPSALLLCTDGYYRAVDCYRLFNGEGLLEASIKAEGVGEVLKHIRTIEISDPTCQKFPRFKPADDTTAIILLNENQNG